MKKNYFKSLLFAFVCGFYALGAIAAVSMFSDYGQIQNVQNYSSNPFWSPTAPYNQRLPQPVYATGADLNADDCIQVVQSLVSVQCMARDNCKNTDVSDIRPTIMVQLSNLPGANYVSSCSGYIDEIFESYKRQYGNTLPNRPTAFPNATTPNPDLNDTGGIQFENPYKQQPTKWQIEQKERSDELQRLQAQNGVGSEHLVKTDFPATYADLSFSERMENDRAGLEPYKDLKAYKTLDVKSESEWCEEHPNDTICKQKTNNSQQPEEKEYDICAGATATLCVQSNDNQYYCQDGTSEDIGKLKQKISAPMEWAMLFPYGIVIGTTKTEEDTSVTDMLQHNCYCSLTKFIPNNGSPQEITNAEFTNAGFAWSTQNNLNDIQTLCTKNCISFSKGASNYIFRDELYKTNIPHTSYDNCSSEESSSGLNVNNFNDIKTNNLFNLEGESYMAKNADGDFTAYNKSREQATTLALNEFDIVFPYGSIKGSASCNIIMNDTISCCAIVTSFTNNQNETETLNSSPACLGELDLNYTDMDDCGKKCAPHIAYTTFFGSDDSIQQWRKWLFFLTE